MDFTLPADTILRHADIKDLGLIQHLMVEAEDTLVLCVRGLRGLCWGHVDVEMLDFRVWRCNEIVLWREEFMGDV